MKKSIRYYYFTSIAAVLVASLLVMGLIQTYLSTTFYRREKESALEQVVDSLVEGAARGNIAQDVTDMQEMQIVDYIGRVADVNILMVDNGGYVIYAFGAQTPPPGTRFDESFLRRVEAEGFRELGRLGGIYDKKHYTYAQPLYNSAGILIGYVVASSDASGLNAYVADMMSSFVLASSLVLLLSSLLALILTNRVLNPLRRVSEAAKKFGEGDYAARVPVEGDDELAQLAVTFNDMANSFEATDTSRRSFMGNIAHELRTPMTSIKGFIDGILDGTIPPEKQAHYLKIVSEEVGRLARLTQNMLDVSRLEAGEYVPNTTVFNIWGPLVSVFESTEQRLAEKQIQVTGLAGAGQAMVQADEDFVHQVLFNLVDNAIKFTNEGGQISTTVVPGRGFVTISVRNTGMGIAAETLPHVFDRFYKEDRSRSLHAGGSGLGLHICKVLVGLMGGRVWAESKEGEYSEFFFTLLTAPAKKSGTRQTTRLKAVGADRDSSTLAEARDGQDAKNDPVANVIV